MNALKEISRRALFNLIKIKNQITLLLISALALPFTLQFPLTLKKHLNQNQHSIAMNINFTLNIALS